MNANAHHTTITFSTAWKIMVVAIILFCVAGPSFGQNTRGDRPASSRESRFTTPFRKSGPSRKTRNKRRIKASERSMAGNAHAGTPHYRASGKERPGKPIRPIFAPKPRSTQKAWRGDIAGYRVRSRESAGSARNVYPQYGKYNHNPSVRPKSTQHAVSNRSTLNRLKRLQGPVPKEGGPKPRVVPPSNSRAFIARKSINVYANFPRPKRRGERATTRDLAGHRLRQRNHETSRGGVIAPSSPWAGRRPRGDRAYKGPAGGYRSATRGGENAWTGDVAGRRVRGRNFTSKKHVEGTPTRAKRPRSISGAFYGKARRMRSATQPAESRTGISPLPPRAPGAGTESLRKYQSGLRGRRPLQGGGSRSGGWNNGGRALPSLAPRRAPGVSVFQGNIKGSRPEKGGGSISGRLWNNKQQPLRSLAPKRAPGVSVFQGNIRAHRPDKGGGSVSGKLWNNNQQPIIGRAPKTNGREARFQGNIRGHRPEKGGGSVSGKLWNNNEQPIMSDPPPNNKPEKLQIKVKRRAYVKNDNSADEALKKLKPTDATYQAGNLQVKVKRRDYVRNKNLTDDATLKLKPTDATYQAGELQVKVKQREYGKKPHAAEGAMPGIKPTKATVKASEYARSMKRNWDYIHNPSSADEALKTREPGKAFARASAYQGNIKMQKFRIFEKNRELHPDTKFIKLNKNNVDDERDMLTNFKLWWARLFRKQDTQPDHLKEKGKKPRYDKGEAGLWND